MGILFFTSDTLWSNKYSKHPLPYRHKYVEQSGVASIRHICHFQERSGKEEKVGSEAGVKGLSGGVFKQNHFSWQIV